MQTEQQEEKPLSAADKKFLKELEAVAKDIEKQEKKAKKKNKKNKQNDDETEKTLELDDDYQGAQGPYSYMIYSLNKASVEEDKSNNACCIIL